MPLLPGHEADRRTHPRNAAESRVHRRDGHARRRRTAPRVRTRDPHPPFPLTRVLAALGAAFAAAAAARSPLLAQEWRPQIRMAPHLFVQADILGVRPEGTVRIGGGSIEASQAKGGSAHFAVDFSAGSDHVTGIDVRVSDVTIGEGALKFSVASVTDVTHERRAPARIERSREATLTEGGSCLHQVYEDPSGERSIVLTLTAESRTVPEVAAPSASARTVVFQVALSRAGQDGSGSSAPLETDVLRTFDGSPVSYSFTRMARRLELTLAPNVTSESVVLVEATLRAAGAEASGVEDAERTVLVHKSQVLSRGSSFDLTVQGSKDEPGYVFNVRAEF